MSCSFLRLNGKPPRRSQTQVQRYPWESRLLFVVFLGRPPLNNDALVKLPAGSPSKSWCTVYASLPPLFRCDALLMLLCRLPLLNLMLHCTPFWGFVQGKPEGTPPVLFVVFLVLFICSRGLQITCFCKPRSRVVKRG